MKVGEGNGRAECELGYLGVEITSFGSFDPPVAMEEVSQELYRTGMRHGDGQKGRLTTALNVGPTDG